MILNIFWLYNVVFVFIYVLCYFNWSFLVTPIKGELINFFIFVFIINLILGYVFRKKFIYRKLKKEDKKLKVYYAITILGIICEFLYEKKIPIYEILIKKSGYSYLDFYGIPTIHVILVTFNTFLAIYSLQHYLDLKNKKFILYYIISIIYPILLYIRGIVAFIIISSTILLIACSALNIKKIIFYTMSLLFLLYIFGLAGNKRHYKISSDSSYILTISLATPFFRESFIPKEFIWGYIYITTPIKNLEYNFEDNKDKTLTKKYWINCFVPDFLKKRLSFNFKSKPKLIYPNFTADTGYMQALINGGKIGIYFFYSLYMIIIILYIKIISKSKYYIVAICILQMINILIFYANMFTFSGASFSLVYPVIFYLLKKKRSCK